MARTRWVTHDGEMRHHPVDAPELVARVVSTDEAWAADVAVVDARGIRFPLWACKHPYASSHRAKLAVQAALGWDRRRRRMGIGQPIGLFCAPS
jgi:hypothetical protein